MNETAGERISLTVDMTGFVSVLRDTFQSEHVHLRELIQNCLEAVNMAIEGAHIEKGSIRIDSDYSKHTLTITDNGIGMSKQDLEKYLSRVFLSGFRNFSGDTLGIGRFGFGFFSVFIVADRVDVISKSHVDSDEVWGWSLDKNDGCILLSRLEPELLSSPGTIVSLTINRNHFFGLQSEYIIDQIQKTFLYSMCPIFVNGFPVGLSTRSGWTGLFRDNKRLTMSGEDIRQKFNWKEAAIWVASFREDNGGWLAIVPTSEFPPPLSIYRRGIHIVNDKIIPSPFDRLFTGLIDVDNLNIKPDRETLIRDSEFVTVEQHIVSEIRRILADLADAHPQVMRAVFAAYRNELGRAILGDKDLRKAIGLYYPVTLAYRSYADEAQEGQAVIDVISADSVDEASKYRPLFWTDNPTADTPLVDRCIHLGFTPIVIASQIEADLLQKVCADHEIAFHHVVFQYAEDMRNRTEETPQLDELFRNIVSRNWEIICSRDIDGRYPLRIIPSYIERQKSNNDHVYTDTLFVNLSNRIVNGLTSGVYSNPERVARILFFIAECTSNQERESYDKVEALTSEVIALLEESNNGPMSDTLSGIIYYQPS
jgi:hypothetical protein